MLIDASALDAIDSIEVLDDAGEPHEDDSDEDLEEDSDDASLEVELSLFEDPVAVAPPPPQFVITADPEPELLIVDPEPPVSEPAAHVVDVCCLPHRRNSRRLAPVSSRAPRRRLADRNGARQSYLHRCRSNHNRRGLDAPSDDTKAATEEPSSISSRRLKRQQHKSARARKDKLRSTTAPPPEPAPAPPPPARRREGRTCQGRHRQAGSWHPIARRNSSLRSQSRHRLSFQRSDTPLPPPPVYYPPPQTIATTAAGSRSGAVAPPVKPIPMPVFGAPAPPADRAAAASTRAGAGACCACAARSASSSAPLRIKTDAPTGYVPGRSRETMAPPIDRGCSTLAEPRPFPWKLALAAVLIVAGAIVVGRAYIPSKSATPIESKKVAEAPAPEPAPAAATAPAAGKGDINIETQPAGAKVLLDGKPVGESPLKLTGIPAGRHILTFISTSGEVMKTVRVASGKTVTVDVPIFSGWVAIFAPIVLKISENGKSLGTTEIDRIMLSPGQHELTLVNRDLGFKTVQEVTVDAGEVRSITVEPKGTVSINAVPWAEVWLDGQKLGDTPLANMRVPLGVREFVFKHPQHGEKKVTVTVRADETDSRRRRLHSLDRIEQSLAHS